MNVEQFTIIAIFVATIAALIRFQQHAVRIFACATLSTLAFSFISTEQVLQNAVNPGLITLLLLVICAYSIERTLFLRRFSSYLLNGHALRSTLKTILSTWLASAFLNNTAVVATLIGPIKNNRVVDTNKLLIPLSYAAILGGTLTLIGTSTNLIVNSMLLEKGEQGLSFFAFLPVGLTVSITCMLFVIFMTRLLPSSNKAHRQSSEYFLEAKVEAGSELVGKTVEQNNLRNLESLFLVEIIRDGRLISPVTPSQLIRKGDKLIFSGDVKNVMALSQFKGLTTYAHAEGLLNNNLTEVMIKPSSTLVGKTLKQANFRSRFGAAVVAVRRDGERLSGKLGALTISAGDFIVLAVGPDFVKRTNLSKNFYILSGIKAQYILEGLKEKVALWGFVGAIVTSLILSLPLLNTLLFYLALLIFSKALSVNEIKRRFPLDLWVIVTSALCLATAFENVGVSQLITSLIGEHLSSQSIYIALIGTFLLTLLFTELITNNAAAALVFPLAYSLAEGVGVSVLPFVMAVAFGASASFISPYSYQTNLMVYNAGHYRLKDFVKVGIPMSVIYSVTVLCVLPLFFPFK